jgi:hypothetical protein
LESDEINKIELGDIMTYISNELDTWLDKEFLLVVADQITELEDFVPSTIELHLPDYEARKDFAFSKPEMIESKEFERKEMLDQMAAGTTWEEHVTVYDDFFENHPEFSRLIKDRKAYEKWRMEEVPY